MNRSFLICGVLLLVSICGVVASGFNETESIITDAIAYNDDHNDDYGNDVLVLLLQVYDDIVYNLVFKCVRQHKDLPQADRHDTCFTALFGIFETTDADPYSMEIYEQVYAEVEDFFPDN